MAKVKLQPQKKTPGQYELRIRRLNHENDSLFMEMAERGKALEKLRKLVDGWEVQLPEAFYIKARDVIYEYIKRCSK